MKLVKNSALGQEPITELDINDIFNLTKPADSFIDNPLLIQIIDQRKIMKIPLKQRELGNIKKKLVKTFHFFNNLVTDIYHNNIMAYI